MPPGPRGAGGPEGTGGELCPVGSPPGPPKLDGGPPAGAKFGGKGGAPPLAPLGGKGGVPVHFELTVTPAT